MAATMFGEKVPFLSVSETRPDIYNDKKDPLPGRWRACKDDKKPQWSGSNVVAKPHGNKGYFSSPAHAKVLKDKEIVDTYTDKTSYKDKPRPKAGVSFGSNDAGRRDQFTVFIEQERYREQLRRERKFMESTAAKAAGTEDPRMKEAEAAAEELRKMGASRKWGPSRRMGAWSTSSDDIGFGMDEIKFTSPRRGKVATTRQFEHSGHLGMPTVGTF